jgi:hypothetical protein
MVGRPADEELKWMWYEAVVKLPEILQKNFSEETWENQGILQVA